MEDPGVISRPSLMVLLAHPRGMVMILTFSDQQSETSDFFAIFRPSIGAEPRHHIMPFQKGPRVIFCQTAVTTMSSSDVTQ